MSKRAVWRWALFGLAGLLVLLAALGAWVVRGFDGERFARAASDWMRAQHGRELVFGGPVRLQLWPQPSVQVQQLSLSEPGQPQQRFAAIESASLSLRLRPLLTERRAEIDEVVASGVTLAIRRGADGRRNIDDLLQRAAGDGAPHAGSAPALEKLQLDRLALQVDDRVSGLRGRLAITRLQLGAFGPGLRSPLQLQAQADLQQPRLAGTLDLKGGLQLLPAARPGATPQLRLEQADLRLAGEGFDIEALDARLQAASLLLDRNAGAGEGGGTRAELAGLQLQFSGRRQGWQIQSGRLQLARLQFDSVQRSLDLEALALQLQGRGEPGALSASLDWPKLSVQGGQLQGGAVKGELQLDGALQLKLQLGSSAPSGDFERIVLPGLKLGIDGRRQAGAVQGQAEGTLVLAPAQRSAALDPMQLRLRLDDPTLPPLQIALDGQARFSPEALSGRVDGTLNDQRMNAQLDLQLAAARPRLDLQARFETLDLSRFTPPAQRGAAPAPAAASTAVDLSPLRRADARLDIAVAQLLRPPYRIDALQLQADVDDGVLNVRRAAGRAWGGSFEASGSADAGSGRVALRLRAEQMDVRALLADTTGYDGLRGRGLIEADLHSRGATVGALRSGLDGTLRLALQPAALRGVDLAQTLRGWRSATQDRLASDTARQTEFSRLQGSFVLRGGVARNSDLDGSSEFLSVGGEGTIDLGQGRLDYLLRTRVQNTASGRAGPEMVLLNGVTVPVQLSGPFGQVEWQVNWATVTAAVAALSVPNVARGALGTAARGATGVVRGAAGLLRSLPGAAPAASAPP